MRLVWLPLLLLAFALPAWGSGNLLQTQHAFFDLSGTRGPNPAPALDTQRPQSLQAASPPFLATRTLRLVGKRKVTLAGDRGREAIALTLVLGDPDFLLRTPDGATFAGRVVERRRSGRKLVLLLAPSEGTRFVEAAVAGVFGDRQGLRDLEPVRGEVRLVAKLNRRGDRVKLRTRVRFAALRDGKTVHGTARVRAFAALD